MFECLSPVRVYAMFFFGLSIYIYICQELATEMANSGYVAELGNSISFISVFDPSSAVNYSMISGATRCAAFVRAADILRDLIQRTLVGTHAAD